MDILRLSSGFKDTVFGSQCDDDFSDRLNYRYTVALLTFFSVILTTRQYSSEVIRCWVPAHFKPSYEAYVSQICWVQNTYHIPHNEQIPKTEIEREKSEIKYYQWVSFVLLFQAFMFYVPRIFWGTFSSRCGLNIADLIQAADKYKAVDQFDKRHEFMNYMVKSIDQLIDDQRRMERKTTRLSRLLNIIIPCSSRYNGNYIIMLYLITKIIYIFNTVFQVYLIGGFLGENFMWFGYNFLSSILKGNGWTVSNSEYFPKVTLCDFMIREIGNLNKSHRYTVQCVLPINLFNQQIFTVIWFWYCIVLAWNITHLFVWIKKAHPNKAKKFLKQRTNLFNENVKQKLVPKRFEHFLMKYLEADGIFILRLIGNNVSDYVATDLIENLWCQHDEKYGALFPSEPHKAIKKCSFRHREEPKAHDPVRKVDRLTSVNPEMEMHAENRKANMFFPSNLRKNPSTEALTKIEEFPV